MKHDTGHPQSVGLLGRFEQHRAIRDARELSGSEKVILYTLWDYANEVDECWPSLKTIALGAGLSEGGAGRVLARLTKSGIVVSIKPSMEQTVAGGRGKTTVRRIDYARLSSLTDRSDYAENPRSAREFRNRSGATETSALRGEHPRAADTNSRAQCENTRRARDEQTITNHENISRTEQKGQIDLIAHKDGWMPDPGISVIGASTEPVETVRDALVSFGVRGVNLDRLEAAPGLTVSIVRDENRNVKIDPNVRNNAAVLVKRLSERLGAGSMKRNGAISDDVKRYAAQIEQLRRKSGGNGDAR